MKKAVNFLAVLGVVAMVMMGTAYAQSDLEVLDLTVSGNDVQFAGGGWGADSKPMVDFNQGGSRIYDDMHLRIETDDYLYLSPGTAVYSRTIIPQVNAAYDLGETQTRWKDLYLSGTVNAYGLVVSGPVKIGDGFLAADVDELNILDGVTASTAELNLMDGVTATTAELNYVDGVTSAIQTQLGAKLGLAGGTMTGAVNLAGASTVATGGTLNIVDAGGLRYAGTAVTSTAAELNILDGVTATATELNLIDGVTATTAELNILDGVTSTAAELNILDGVTATATELNLIDG
ncbi:hypothetical protein KKB83_04880, partial [Patescibacteria group bacterium]|nr:hypothetical protein [Patescibacteria group bacterium]